MCLQSNIKFNLRLSQSFFFLKQYLHKVLFPAKSSCILSYTLNHMCKGAFFICLYLRYFTVAGMLCQDIFNSFTPSLNSALIWLVLKQVYRLFTCLKSSVPWNIAAHILLILFLNHWEVLIISLLNFLATCFTLINVHTLYYNVWKQ